MATPWRCVHCAQVFTTPVASELGQRRCQFHPGAFWGSGSGGGRDDDDFVLQLDEYPCCGSALAADNRGCRRGDHVPALVYMAASGDDHRRLFLPAYVLDSRVLDKHTQPLSGTNKALMRCGYRPLVEFMARREPTFWEVGLDTEEDVQAALARARERCDIIHEWRQAVQRHMQGNGFRPFAMRIAAAARLAEINGNIANGVADYRLASMLTQPAHAPLAWRPVRDDALAMEMAYELRDRVPLWVALSIVDSETSA